jgi:hypothetical protein
MIEAKWPPLTPPKEGNYLSEERSEGEFLRRNFKINLSKSVKPACRCMVCEPKSKNNPSKSAKI